MMWQVLIHKLDLPNAELNTKNSTNRRLKALFDWVFGVQLDLLEKMLFSLREKPCDLAECQAQDQYMNNGTSLIKTYKDFGQGWNDHKKLTKTKL